MVISLAVGSRTSEYIRITLPTANVYVRHLLVVFYQRHRFRHIADDFLVYNHGGSYSLAERSIGLTTICQMNPHHHKRGMTNQMSNRLMFIGAIMRVQIELFFFNINNISEQS